MLLHVINYFLGSDVMNDLFLCSFPAIVTERGTQRSHNLKAMKGRAQFLSRDMSRYKNMW